MKSERRHQLQQNELADALGGSMGKLRPYAKPVGAALVVLVVLLLVIGFVRSRSSAYQAAATREFLFATGAEDPERYRAIGMEYAETPAGRWALLVQADLYLDQGIDALYVDREEAAGLLDAAIEGYQQVIERAKYPLERVRAEYGLAKAYESRGELEKAEEHYRYVAENADSEALAEEANERIERLASEEMQQFYAWFASYNPAPPAGAGGLDFGTGDARLEDVPDQPLGNLPSFATEGDEAAAEPPAEEATEPAPPATEPTEPAPPASESAEPAEPAEPAAGTEQQPETAAESATEAPAAAETPADESSDAPAPPAAETAPVAEEAEAPESAEDE